MDKDYEKGFDIMKQKITTCQASGIEFMAMRKIIISLSSLPGAARPKHI